MKLSVGLLVVAVLAGAFAHHEHNHDDDSHPCAQGLYKLEDGKPACLALIPRWYHDHASGECKQFDYDGCNKNENHFESKEDCDKTCATWHEAHKDHHHGHHNHVEGKSHDHANCENHGHEHSHDHADGHHHEGHEGHEH